TETLDEYELIISDYLNENIGYRDAGLTINTVKSDSLETARGMSIFPMMFLAFGMIIILAGIILIINIFITQSESRRFELGLIRALGFRRQQLSKILIFEGIIYSGIASIIGVVLGLAVGFMLIEGLNSIWSATVEGNVIPFYFKPESLVIAFVAGLLITLVTILIISIRIGRMNVVQAMQTVPSDSTSRDLMQKKLNKMMALYGFLSIIGLLVTIYPLSMVIGGSELNAGVLVALLLGPNILFIGLFSVLYAVKAKRQLKATQLPTRNRYYNTAAGLLILIYTIIFDLVIFNMSEIPFLELYLLSGILLVFSTVMIIVTNLGAIATKLNNAMSKVTGRSPNSLFKLASLYPVRALKRTGMTIGLFALVLFIIAALSVNVAIQTANISHQAATSGGGYDIMGESNLPVKFDLNNPDELANNNINSPTLSLVDVTAIKMVGEEGGTCSNMNVRYPPRLLGVDSTFRRDNKFGFVSAKWDEDKPKEVWAKLNDELPGNRIPIVVEYNTLVWIYEEELGSIFELEVESGQEYELEVVGVADSSVLAGTFIMSEENLDKLYPISADYHLFLFKLKNSGDESQIATDLEQELSVLGMDTITIQDRLLDDIQYEQSFMALFQVFLGLGLIVGIVGLGVITLRTIHERRWEIGVLRAIGFRRNQILKLFLTEIIFIVIIGILIGILVGILSSYLSFNLWKGGSYQYIIPWESLLLLGGTVLLVTILCVIYPAYKASKIPPVEALRSLE
ncbi:MAG: FtsX-like permease family protein, partial [Thermoplasmata archaeon]|nr:FtsX-like permease family protein [Thermoplasmata archaeon]